jgi:protein gp37
MGRTSIEWTDLTVNPGIYGCAELSPACANCYAAKMAHRLVGAGVYPEGVTTKRASGVHWSGRVVVDAVPSVSANMIRQLPKKKPGRVFVTSMSDVGLDEVPDEFLDRLFGIFAVMPHLTFQVLTKRPARLLRWFQGWHVWEAVQSEAEHHARTYMGLREFFWDSRGDPAHWRPEFRQRRPWPGWPLPNVWIGCTVEDQRRADERIPLLVQIPARVRFLSCEPLLGPVDLSQWIGRIDHCSSCRVENPPQVDDRCPECGDEGSLISTWGEWQAERFRTHERYENDGPQPSEDGPQLHWVIAGGESGGNARATDPAWAHSLRDQCVAAGVPFLWKQWGQWAPHPKQDSPWAGTGQTTTTTPGGILMVRHADKHAAGRELDGRTWDEVPDV